MSAKSATSQLSTFYLGDRIYGIDVTQVQEVTKPLPVRPIRLAKSYIKGLINLRGQLTTAIGLKELFGIDGTETADAEKMTVVCKADGMLISLLVDRIGDVIEARAEDFETPPETIDPEVRRFMLGVYKTEGKILSVIGIDRILNELNQAAA